MKCTSCKEGQLTHAYVDALFPCLTCSHCGGNWVKLADYLRWQESQPSLPPANDASLDANDSTNALLCPETGSFMLKYRISHKNDHRLDLSPAANAIWLDKGEWELLKQEGLALQLNAIFTDQWQKKIRDAKTEETLSGLYQEMFKDNYAALKEFKTIFDQMENRAEAVAYLMASNPYRV